MSLSSRMLEVLTSFGSMDESADAVEEVAACGVGVGGLVESVIVVKVTRIG